MSSAVFKPAIPASERPQTHALDSVATGIGSYIPYHHKSLLTLPVPLVLTAMNHFKIACPYSLYQHNSASYCFTLQSLSP